MNTDLLSRRAVGFTVIELIAVLVVITVLGVMLLTALAGARPNSAAFQCMNNLRQLQVGWQAYSTENNDGICPTGGSSAPAGASNWVFGYMNIPADATNGALIQKGALWPYIKLLSVYKCPADPSTSSGVPKVRSISMNAWMNPYQSPVELGLSGPGRVFRKQSDIRSAMPPSQCWVVLDENPLIINNGWFVVASSYPSGPNHFTWISPPATYHDKGCGISLADGHAEIKRWRDKTLLGPPILLFMPADPDVPPGYGDLRWLQNRTTVLR